MKKSSTYELIWKAVRKIPHGKVATYGQIAKIAGMEGQSRLVGYALHALPNGSDVPWHRVINARGRISLPGPSAKRQRKLLESESIEFNPAGRIDLRKHQWISDFRLLISD